MWSSSIVPKNPCAALSPRGMKKLGVEECDLAAAAVYFEPLSDGQREP